MKIKKEKIIRGLLTLIGVGMLAFGGVLLYLDNTSREEESEIYDKVIQQAIVKPVLPELVPDSETQVEIKEWAYQIDADFVKLNEINMDVVGWIYFENETSISYPLMYSTDDDKYDSMMYDGTISDCGSISIDAVNKPDLTDKRTIIYGHNRADTTMFGKLKRYKDADYWKDHQYFQIIHENGYAYRYQIFSYFDVLPTELSSINTVFNEKNSYVSCLEKLQSRSRHQHGIEVTEEDQIVTLVTCAYYGTQRFLVNAVLVDTYNLHPEWNDVVNGGVVNGGDIPSPIIKEEPEEQQAELENVGEEEIKEELENNESETSQTEPGEENLEQKEETESGQQEGIEEPSVEEPGTEQPGAEQPGAEQPGAEQPGTEQPDTEQPGTEQPGTEQPGNEQPDNEQPGDEDISNGESGGENAGDEGAGNQPQGPINVLAGRDDLTANNVSAGSILKRLFDGDVETHGDIIAGPDGKSWICIDLGDIYKVDRWVMKNKIFFGSTDFVPLKYQLFVTTGEPVEEDWDKLEWKDVALIDNASKELETEATFDAVEARCIKIEFLAGEKGLICAADNQARVAEIELYSVYEENAVSGN